MNAGKNLRKDNPPADSGKTGIRKTYAFRMEGNSSLSIWSMTTEKPCPKEKIKKNNDKALGRQK